MSARGTWRALRARVRDALIERAPRLALRLFECDDDELGRAGEALAARALLTRGYVILGRRMRSQRAEIDLLARDGEALVAVEVKTGLTFSPPRPKSDAAIVPSLRWRPAGRVGQAQAARVARAARRLTRERVRVDVVEVLVDLHTREARVLHHLGVDSKSRERLDRAE